MDFSRDELLWINNALNEVLHGPEAIEQWEFQTRIGGDRDQVQALLSSVSKQVGCPPSRRPRVVDRPDGH
jgi:hypothetical protein